MMDSKILIKLNLAAETIARAIELERLDTLAPLREVADELRRLAGLRDHQPITRAKLANELSKIGAMLGDADPKQGLEGISGRLLYLAARIESFGVRDEESAPV